MLKEFFKSRYMAALLFLYALFYSLSQVVLKPVDSDLFFILTLGKDIVSLRDVPHTLMHTVHDGFHTVVPQHMTDLMDYIFYSTMGFSGVYLLNIMVFCTTASVAYIYISRNVSYNLNAGIIILSFIMPAISLFVNGRPQMVTQLLCYLLILSNDVALKTWKYRIPPTILIWPILSFLQINFHATSWPIFMLAAIALSLPELIHPIRAVRNNSCFRIASLLLMGAAAFINPYGGEALTYLIKYELYKGDNVKIGEMMQPFLFSLPAFYCIVGFLIILIYAYHEYGHIKADYLALALGGVFMAFNFQRCAWMSALGILPILVSLVDSCLPACEPSDDKRSSVYDSNGNIDLKKLLRTKDAFFPVVASLFLIAAVILNCLYLHFGHFITDSESTPIKAIEYLDKNEDSRTLKLYTGYNNGAYAEFCGYTIYIDARVEPYTKAINGTKDVLDEFSKLMYDKDFDYLAFIKDYAFDYMIVSDNSRLYTYLRDREDFKAVVQGEGYALFRVPNTYRGT